MDTTDKGHTGCSRTHRPAPTTVEKYREAVELYASTDLTCVEISRRCSVSLAGFKGYICKYRRDLLLPRYGIRCDPEEAAGIGMGQRRSQRPATRAKYREAIAACDSMDYIDCNVSQIAREFGLSGTNLGKQLRTHYPGVIERREEVRRRLGLDDNLPRGTRPQCRERYAGAVELLRGDRYVTMQEAAERCNVSYQGLKQHLIFYHKELIDNRINIRKRAVGQQRKGKITGRGSLHAPQPATVEKYAEALRLYGTTAGSLKSLARRFGVNECSLRDFIKRHFPEAVEGHRRAVERDRGRKAAGMPESSGLVLGEAPALTADTRRTERRAGSEAETILRYNSKI